ncbi:MAG: D-glycero-beta-D-manno-heptose 1-phosphate adenylyltransferase [Flavobacteriales bacterium]
MSDSTAYQNKIQSLEHALSVRQAWRDAGEKVVFTNGVFDILHPGHVHYLSEAKALGTKLILGLNSDGSARDLNKGPARPINSQKARALVLAGLESVDLVVIFDEPTPLQIISVLLPDVLVKGGDYEIKDIVGAEEVMNHGGEVKQLSFLKGYSTTNIEKRIIQAHGIE